MTTDGRRVLAWIVGVPFFLLPVPLTVDAPDIFGGYAIHARQGALFALLGLVCGLVAVYGARGLVALRARPTAYRTSVGVAWLLGLLLLALLLATAASGAGRQLARFLGALPLGLEQRHAPDFPHPAVVASLLLVMGRLTWARADTVAPVRALAVVAVVLQGGAWLHANRFTTAEIPLGVLLLGAAALAGGWPWLRGTRSAGNALAWGAVLGALFAPWLGVATRMVAPLSLLPSGPPVRAVAVTGALLATAWTAWVLRRFLQESGDDGVSFVARGLRRLAARAPLLLALLVLALVTSTLAMLSGGLLVELFGAPAPGRWAPTDLPHFNVLAWWVLLLGLGAGLRTRADAVRLMAGVSSGFALLTVGRSVRVAAPAHAFTVLVVIALLMLAAVLALPRLRGGLARVLLGALLWAGPLVAAPLVVRYLIAIVAGGQVGPGVCVAVGVLLSAPIPWLVLRVDSEELVDLPSLVVRLPLLSVALVLPIYVTVHAGLRPGTFALTVVLLFALVVGTRLSAGPLARLPRLPVSVAAWLLFYAGFLQTAVFKLGPGEAQCASIVENTTARVLLSRHAEGGEYLEVYPYDAVPLPGGDVVLASFKRIDKRGGFVEVMDPAAPETRARTRVQREGTGGPLWPERIVTDPTSGRALVQVIGVGAHGMWELVPDAANSLAPVTVGRRIPLQYEPGNPAVDAERRTLAVTYVPNREGGNPLVEVFDLDTLAPRGNTGGATSRMMQMADFVETDRGTGFHYAPTLFDFVRFGVVEVRPDLALGRHRETFHPVIGLAADPSTRRLFLTNPLAGVMEVLDLETLEVVQTLDVGTFPRDVAHDPGRNRLYVANYGDGSVVTFSTEGGRLEELARADVGWLLRGLGVDEGSGRVVAASGCGVFEVAGVDGALP
ncbi:MAG: hypothetical protein KDA24_24645 [Deltaproteobacteria bacterium]|nr:hypothetical protein [Deltaproteobacteria bacterium]